jgi:calcium/calmodulin-dependent protein kinase I
MPESEVCAVTAALVSAVHYLHAHGLVHRDLKPENILYRSLGAAPTDFVLADLGLSAFLPLDDPDAVVVGHAGSPGYCPPEMLDGLGVGYAGDIWSLGLVVYAMLSGRTPFEAVDPVELHRESRAAVIAYPERYWAHVSPVARDFVARCLHREPKERMTAAEASQHPVRPSPSLWHSP